MTSSRPSIVGPDAGPEPPFPVLMEGQIISGFGRGSKELGIPTANLPVDAQATPWIADCVSGVYFGWAMLDLRTIEGEATTTPASASVATAPLPPQLYPMVMSIGYNPFYQNDTRTAEVHLLHKFDRDFYGAHLKLAILGFIRPELNYTTLDALVADIRFDCMVAHNALARPGWTPAGVAVRNGGDDSAKEEANNGNSIQGTLAVPWLFT